MTELNVFAKEFKSFLLPLLKNIFESNFLEAFQNSIYTIENKKHRFFYQIYTIYDDDIPLIRDLKTLLNMVTIIEKITDEAIMDDKTNQDLLEEKNAELPISIFKIPKIFLLIKKVGFISDLQLFVTNYNIYMSSNSILTHYLIYAKEFTWIVLLPLLTAKIQELKALYTQENIQKIVNIVIENLVLLEQYKENYEKRKISSPKEKEKENNDFITTLLRKGDSYLKKIYKDFEENFPLDIKSEAKNENLDNVLYYYKTNPADRDTVKNIKLLLNGIIAIKKVHNDRTEQVGFFGSYGWISTMIQNIKTAYYSFGEFDYEAIWSEQSSPFMKIIKDELQKLNATLEKIACIAGQFEIEFHLKEGILLNTVRYLIVRYNEITYQLKIPIDYIKQKDVFFLSRFEFNENYLIEIDKQVQTLREFLIYKNYPLISIPPNIIVALQMYITKYEDEICMDHDLLLIYQICLEATLNAKRDWTTVFMSSLESIATRLGRTIHSDVIQTLNSRMRYLTKQQRYLEEYLEDTVTHYQENPYLYVTVPQKEGSKKEAIVNLLKNHIRELNTEKEILTKTRDEEIAVKTKTSRFSINPDDVKPAMKNLITLKSKELLFFQSTLKKYEEKNTFEPIDSENNLPPKSAVLIAEMAHALRSNP